MKIVDFAKKMTLVASSPGKKQAIPLPSIQSDTKHENNFENDKQKLPLNNLTRVVVSLKKKKKKKIGKK